MSSQWPLIIAATTSVFAVIGVGAAVRRIGWLSEEADRSLLKLAINLFLPCLIFTVVADNPAMKQAGNVLLAPAVGFGALLVGLAAAMLATRLGPRLTGLHDAAQRRTFALSVGTYNYGFLPLPLVKVLFGDRTLGVLFVHNVGVGLALWTIGIMMLSGAAGRRWWRRMVNPPSLAVVVALAVNYLDPVQRLPHVAQAGLGILRTAIEWLGEATVPVALVLVGATMADELRSGGGTMGRADSAKVVAWSCLLRLVLLPLTILGAAVLLPASYDLKCVLVVEAAMPSAVFPVLLARHYGGDPGTALRAVVSTSLLSLLTIPIWISIGLEWVGAPTGP